MSRAKAFETLSFDKYRGSMEGIYSTCVTRDTLDESPMAYKAADEIISLIGPTAEIIHRIKPLYNFKAAE
jgi:RNA-splicing ligase RtcB